MRAWMMNIIAILVMTFCLGACAAPELMTVRNDGEVEFSLRVAPAVSRRAGTRAVADKEIASLTVLPFVGNGDAALLAQAPYSVPDWTATEQADESIAVTFLMKLDRSISDKASLSFIIFANLPEEEAAKLSAGSTTLADLKAMTMDIADAVGTHPVICGECTWSDLFASGLDTPHEVTMLRNVAAVEVKLPDESASEDFTLYGAPSDVALTAALASSPPQPSGEAGESHAVRDGGRLYVAPVANNSEADPFALAALPFIVVKAPYGDAEYYYRLAFVAQDADTAAPVALSVLPNHRYEFRIKNVASPGYASETEAAQGVPSGPADVDYTIADIQPTIFNMTSDGRCELGITDMVEDRIGDACEKEFHVKCFPAVEDVSELQFSLGGADWVRIDEDGVTSEEVEDADGQKATLFTFKAKLDRNAFVDYREARLTVSWPSKGLSTTMRVCQYLSFTADKYTDISLNIYEADKTLYRSISDYWTFLRGEGADYDNGTAGATLKAPILHGAGEEENGGRIRTRGLHFPVLNGGRTYGYTIQPKGLAADVVKYKVFLKNSFGFTSTLTISPDTSLADAFIPIDEPVTIGMTDDNEFVEVAESVLVLRFYDADGNVVDLQTLDIYHVGLFDWSDYPAYRADRTNVPGMEQAWYYYEAIPFMEGDDVVYWLDRNVGARSSGFDIADATGQSIFTQDRPFPYLGGNGGAMGGCYHSVATPSNEYGDPEMKAEFGPKGYSIPSGALWNEIRNSSEFITDKAFAPSGVSYYSAYLQLDDGSRMYFPKNSQRQDGTITSEGSTGHYWTSTAASGFEKDEIGKWLDILVLSGNSTSVSRARIVNPVTAMSARLVNEGADSGGSFQTCLKVKGATHVFLYAENTWGTREWASPWPGTAVTNPDIAFAGEVNFVYESSRDVKYKVIFNFVSESGAITTMAASNPEKGINAEGWDAEGRFIFDESHRRIE